jgi:SAM-dependent methyltransferase
MPTLGGDVDYGAFAHPYARHRRPDPRIAARLWAALGEARTVLNVGAGAGSYEPPDRHVIAIEPSAAMRAQRLPDRPAINAFAEALPLDDASVDAAMATMTVHQWSGLAAGLAELRRVSRGPVVLLVGDPDRLPRFWLNDYAPALIATEQRRYPAIADLAAAIGARARTELIPIPLDCTDGLCEAFYGRPERLLDEEVRRAQSSWSFLEPGVEETAVGALDADLRSGLWDDRHGHLRTQPNFEGALTLMVGYPH